MSTLLLVFAFVLTFVPGMLQPFTASGQEETVVADRIADHLTEGLLAESGASYVLNTTCTVDFFEGTANPNCRYSGDNLSDRVGLSKYHSSGPYRQQVNVSIVGSVSESDGATVLCWDADTATMIEGDESSCNDGISDVVLKAGDSPPNETGSIVTARRVVSIDGEDATLLVRVW